MTRSAPRTSDSPSALRLGEAKPKPVRFFSAVRGGASLAVCPICFDSAGALTGGARAGALTLAIVAALVIAGFVRFAWRLR